MTHSEHYRRFAQFRMRSLLLFITTVCCYLALAPRLQDAREAWRRRQLHVHVTDANIYVPHFYTYACSGCRRRIITAITNDTLDSQRRVLWINEARCYPRNSSITTTLEDAATAHDPDVAKAARDALTFLKDHN
jgi:hypothetical protein